MIHIDIEGWRVLDESRMLLLESERLLCPEGAFSRVATPPELFTVLTHYLEPAHSLLGIDQREVQLEVVDALMKRLWSTRAITPWTVCQHCVTESKVSFKRARQLIEEARSRERFITR